jgi:hypothetical protein
MRDEQSHSTRWPVTPYVVFSEDGIVTNFCTFCFLQESFLQSNADRMIIINEIPQIGGMLVKAMAVPGQNCHNGNEKEKEKGRTSTT